MLLHGPMCEIRKLFLDFRYAGDVSCLPNTPFDLQHVWSNKTIRPTSSTRTALGTPAVPNIDGLQVLQVQRWLHRHFFNLGDAVRELSLLGLSQEFLVEFSGMSGIKVSPGIQLSYQYSPSCLVSV